MFSEGSDPFVQANDFLPPEFHGLLHAQPVTKYDPGTFDHAFYLMHKADPDVKLPTTPTENPQAEKEMYLAAFRLVCKGYQMQGFNELAATLKLIEQDPQQLDLIYVRVKCHLCFRGPVFYWINESHINSVYKSQS